MSVLPQPYSCNSCGRLRAQDSNHWLLVWINRGGSGGPDQLIFESWWDRRAASEYVKHLCGQACSIRMFIHWLLTGNLDVPLQTSAPQLDAGRE